jgi:hypothetical protein
MYGQVTNPHAMPCRGRRIITTADEDFIYSLITANPATYLDEIQDELEMVCGVLMSQSQQFPEHSHGWKFQKVTDTLCFGTQ